MSNCEQCNDKGWVKSWGRLGDEIQVCQDCFKFFSDEQAYREASKEIDVSKYKFDKYVFYDQVNFSVYTEG